METFVFFFKMFYRVPFGCIFEMSTDLSVRKNAQMVLMVEVIYFPPAQNLAIVTPSYEMIAKAPFLMQMPFKPFQGLAWGQPADVIFLPAFLMKF